jgi:dihydroorotase-like cyclic amidohydrolase
VSKLLFTGRTVVTAGGGFRADVLVEDERAVAVGKDADIVLWKPDLETAATVVDYTPHGGVTFHGGLASVYVRGSLDYRDGEAVGERGSGGFIERSFAAPGQEVRV